MREALFLKQNAAKWKDYEVAVKDTLPADELAKLFVELTDDLSYAKTFYPKSNTAKYLNGLAAQFHQKIYKNKKEKRGRIWWFWQFELPVLFKQYHRQFLYAFLFFIIFSLMGAVSAKYDENFLRLILGDGYVNKTLDNIEHGDPFAVYKSGNQLTMFFGIAFNNIKVAFIAYVLGITFCVGTLWMLMSNGLMMGSFQYFFISKGLGTKFILVVFIHGTLELWSIIIAGAAGLIMGNSFLFPGTFTRTQSLIRGGKDGLKIVVGLVPLFLTAAFFESFVTRYSNMPVWLSINILAASTTFIIWYFLVYPIRLNNKITSIKSSSTKTITNKNFNAWITKKWNLES
ncbi:MAG: stage II sporulation protein M [Pedobacter sp.]|nr:stage II sporulation protein M [Chitinophagaceae bacterium]